MSGNFESLRQELNAGTHVDFRTHMTETPLMLAANYHRVACVRLLQKDGSTSLEYASDLWTVREDAVWGAFWTVSLPPNATAVWLGLIAGADTTDTVAAVAGNGRY